MTPNEIAAITVSLESIPSQDFALFLPKNVSAPPAIEPDRQACFPDWRRTTAIMKTARMTCTTERMKLRVSNVTYTSKM